MSEANLYKQANFLASIWRLTVAVALFLGVSCLLALSPPAFMSKALAFENTAAADNNLSEPVNPYPADQQSGVNLYPELKWESEFIEKGYHVIYFGATPEPGLVAAIWPDSEQQELLFLPGMLEPDTRYYWQVVVRDQHDRETTGPLWTFNTLGSIAGEVTSGSIALPDQALVCLIYGEDNGWEAAGRAVTDQDGYYRIDDLPQGEYLIGLASKDNWHPELVAVSGGISDGINIDTAAFELEIVLNEGWNLLSMPRWAESDGVVFPEPLEDNICSWMTLWEGSWYDHTDQHFTLQEALNNPARAVYINVLRPTVVRFNMKETTPETNYAKQELQPGWNLIGSGYENDYRIVLAGLFDFGDGGITNLSTPNELNGKKGFGYTLHWETPLVSLTVPGGDFKPVMYPLDGYWVYLQGDPLTYTTLVDAAFPQQKEKQ